MNAKNHQNIRQLDLNNISVLNYLINTNNTPNGVPPSVYAEPNKILLFSQKVMTSIFEALEKERIRLALVAKGVCDNYWTLSPKPGDITTKYDRGYARTTVRVRGRCVEMLWQRTYFPPMKDNKRQKPRGAHLIKGRGSDYDINKLVSLCRSDYEKKLVIKTETEYRKIRRRLKIIKDIQSLLVQYIRDIELETGNEADISWGQISKRGGSKRPQDSESDNE